MPIKRNLKTISVKDSPAWAIVEFYRAETCNCFACPVYQEEDGRKKATCRKCDKRLEELREFCGGGSIDNFGD